MIQNKNYTADGRMKNIRQSFFADCHSLRKKNRQPFCIIDYIGIILSYLNRNLQHFFDPGQ